MIASLRGVVSSCSRDDVVLDVSGVGYLLAVTPSFARQLREGQERTMYTTMIVRDDAISLVGFPDREELVIFNALISVSGVGTKSALGVLDELSIDDIIHAVSAEDDRPFRKVSGIGPKTAKLIVVQLSGKLPGVTSSTAQKAPSLPADTTERVVQALVALEWSERQARETLDQLEQQPDNVTVPEVLRAALAHHASTVKVIRG